MSEASWGVIVHCNSRWAPIPQRYGLQFPIKMLQHDGPQRSMIFSVDFKHATFSKTFCWYKMKINVAMSFLYSMKKQT